MLRYQLQRAVRRARLSGFEGGSLLAGILVLVLGMGVAVPAQDLGGRARAFGLVGLAAFLACAISRGIRLYRAGAVG